MPAWPKDLGAWQGLVVDSALVGGAEEAQTPFAVQTMADGSKLLMSRRMWWEQEQLTDALLRLASEEPSPALAPETVEDGRVRSTVYHDPLGVVAAITPWNFPMSMPAWLAVPALAAGNTVVLKPSEETPLSGQAYAEALNQFLPPDVLSVVHGADDQGKALVRSDVDMIAFTGSREVGKHIMGAASDGLKRVILELGGKDPMIVLSDADLQAAAAFAVRNSFRNAGQVCVSTERIYVEAPVADAFEALVCRLALQQ